MPTFHLECQYDHGLYYSFLDLKVDGNLIAEGSHSNANGEIDPAEPSDDPIPVDFCCSAYHLNSAIYFSFSIDHYVPLHFPHNFRNSSAMQK